MTQCDEEKLGLIALNWGTNLGPASIRRLCEFFGSAIKVLSATQSQLTAPVLRLKPETIQQIIQLKDNLKQYQAQVSQLAYQKIAVISQFEPKYPKLFIPIQNPPSIICVKGTMPVADIPTIGIVGTRKPTPDGYQASYNFAYTAAQAKITVVSGLALGCDTAAHEGALAGRGNTIAVLGSGILCPYPPQNEHLYNQIASTGAVISEQPPNFQPCKGSLMARNRLISALSRAVLIIQADIHGGALETARQAKQQQKRLFAVNWPVDSRYKQGTAMLINKKIAVPIDPEQTVFSLTSDIFDEIACLYKARQLTLF